MSKRKINYVDIIIILAVVIVLVAGYMYLTKDNSGATSVSNKVNVTYIAEADQVKNEVVQQLKVGDIIVANSIYQNAEITKVEILESYTLDAVDGQIVKLPSAETVKVRVEISGEANKYGPYIELGGQEIKAGARYYIKTDIFEAYGSVVKLIEIDE